MSLDETPPPSGQRDLPPDPAARHDRPRPGARRARRRRERRRNPALRILVGVTAALALAVGGLVVYTNQQLNDIPRFPLELDRPGRPPRSGGDALNILLAGVDGPSNGSSVQQALTEPSWPEGRFRSDAILVLHLPSDRESAQVVSIPRDSYVPVAGHGTTKINAAFSYGGPQLLARTIEDLGGIRIDHVVVVDFEGLARITDIVGGVEIYLPEATHDAVGGGTWQKGTHHLDGEQALGYVRERKSLGRGDLDRVQRQQNFLRAILGRLASAGTLANPVRLVKLAQELSSTVAVDRDLTSGTIRSLVLGSRSLRPDDFTFATVPVTGTPTIDGASVVTLDDVETPSMLEALDGGSLVSWLRSHRTDELPDADEVE